MSGKKIEAAIVRPVSHNGRAGMREHKSDAEAYVKPDDYAAYKDEKIVHFPILLAVT